MSEFVPDMSRERRCGRPEVVYCAGKTPAQVAQIFAGPGLALPFMLGTRATADHFEAVGRVVEGVRYDPVSRLLIRGAGKRREGRVGVVAAGTSDLWVVEEAAGTLEVYGWEVLRVLDVGVAGIHRLFDRLESLRACDVLIAVAGMEGALPSVLGGLVDIPLIAVPTSVGYGAHFGGLAPLLTMLNSCSSGVVVVNIDNGFGAAAAADSILRLALTRAAATNPSR